MHSSQRRCKSGNSSPTGRPNSTRRRALSLQRLRQHTRWPTFASGSTSSAPARGPHGCRLCSKKLDSPSGRSSCRGGDPVPTLLAPNRPARRGRRHRSLRNNVLPRAPGRRPHGVYPPLSGFAAAVVADLAGRLADNEADDAGIVLRFDLFDWRAEKTRVLGVDGCPRCSGQPPHPDRTIAAFAGLFDGGVAR